jgi:uncharacterized protein (TIGR03437 family)
MPSTVTVPQGSASATFSVTPPTAITGWVLISASYNGVSKGVSFTVSSTSTITATTALHDIVCTPKSLIKGSRGICRLTLDQVDDSSSVDIRLTSSSDSLQLPDRIATRPGQSVVDFQVDAAADASGDHAVVTAQLDADAVEATLALASDDTAAIRVPGDQFVKYGSEIRFRASAVDPFTGLSTGALPPGALFDATAGEFRWTPDGTQLGPHEIGFTATDSTGRTTSARVNVQVDSGEPVVTGVVNSASRSRDLACSPGAIAAVQGRWLNDGPSASDPSGASEELAGVKVLINGIAVRMLSAASAELSFLCPDTAPGSQLEVVVQTSHGTAAPIRTIARAAAPGIFSVDGSGAGQGAVLADDGASLAIIRNYRFAGRPAAPGDRVTVYATGLNRLTNISARVGDIRVATAEVAAVPNRPGLFRVAIVLPHDAAAGNNVDVSLQGVTADGAEVSTNLVSIAVEGTTR